MINANGRKIKWSSSRKTVASVNKNGLVKAKKAGKAVITAKIAGRKLKCNVTVHEQAVKPSNTAIPELDIPAESGKL